MGSDRWRKVSGWSGVCGGAEGSGRFTLCRRRGVCPFDNSPPGGVQGWRLRVGIRQSQIPVRSSIYISPTRRSGGRFGPAARKHKAVSVGRWLGCTPRTLPITTAVIGVTAARLAVLSDPRRVAIRCWRGRRRRDRVPAGRSLCGSDVRHGTGRRPIRRTTGPTARRASAARDDRSRHPT